RGLRRARATAPFLRATRDTWLRRASRRYSCRPAETASHPGAHVVPRTPAHLPASAQYRRSVDSRPDRSRCGLLEKSTDPTLTRPLPTHKRDEKVLTDPRYISRITGSLGYVAQP